MENNLGSMLATAARRFGEKPIIVAVDRTLTAHELDRLSTLCAGGLQALGVSAGDRVTLWVENGWRWVICYYGILKLGAVVNPVNIQLTPDEVVFIARDCSSKVVIASADKSALIDGKLDVPVVVDRASGGSALLSVDAWLDQPAGELQLAGLGADASSTAAICYTSGTTGHPKGAVLPHRAIITNTMMTALMHGRTATDIVVSALPLPHVYGNVVMNSAVACGMTLVLLPRFDELTVLEAIQKHRATMFEGVPTMFLKMLNHLEPGRFDLSSLRVCTVGGQTMPAVKMMEVEERFGCPLLELWGMTELAGLGATHPHNGPRRLGSIGIALPLSEAKVVHVEDATREMPRGEVGELVIRGPLVMQGYYANPEATQSAIEADGWLHTGDLVRQDRDGYLYVVDRKKEVIISGGYNVYPAEVERVIAQHPAVSMVAVAAMRDEFKGQAPKAFVVLKHGVQCTSADIISHCRLSLASYKTPQAVAFVDDLPKTSTGKILRRALAETNI